MLIDYKEITNLINENELNFIRIHLLSTVKKYEEIIKEEIIKPTPKVSKLAILTVCPSGFEEAKALVKELVQGKALLFSFSKLNNEDKQRTFDFLNGVAYVINANVEKVTRETILYSPANAKVERLTKLSSLEKKGFQII